MTIPSPIYVPQGAFEVSHDPETCFTTALGSCVAACVWDDEPGFGGMNHLLFAPIEDRATNFRR